MGEADIAGMYHLLGQIAQDVRENNKILNEHSRILAEHGRVLAEHSHMLAEHSHMLAELRQSMRDVQGTLVSHGVWIHELDERSRRIERHLGLPPAA